MEIDAHQLMTTMMSYLWPFIRIAAVLMLVPVLGAQVIPARIRIAFAVLMTMVIAPTLPAMGFIEPLSISGILIIMQQVVVGLAMGFIVLMVFQMFIIGGQVIAMQTGLGFAALVDPGTNNSVPLVSQFYLIFVTLIFVALNGHLVFIELLAESFTLLPVSDKLVSAEALWSLISFSAWMFKGAIQVAIPAIASLLLVNLSFGVMTRAAPQLNIFAVGFPITLTFGLIVVYLTIFTLEPHIQSMLDKGMTAIKVFLG